MEPLKAFGASRSRPAGELGSGRLGKLLQRTGRLHPVPYDPETGRRGSRLQPARWSVDAPPPEGIPSSRQVPEGLVERGQRVVSVTLRPKDLRYFRRNPRSRGLNSERPAYVSFFEDGELLYGGGAGFRLHGGLSRIYSRKKSYRLYFHPSYGDESLPSGVLPWEAASPVSRLVLHNDTRTDFIGRDWSFAGPLAYDIARQVGCIAPRTAPAQFVLNGELQEAIFLTERLDERYVEALLGHPHFTFIRTKRDSKGGRFRRGNPDHYKLLRQWANEGVATLEEAEKRVDLDNLFRWFISVTFCATTDAFQGPLVRDETDPRNRWFWINWDMDHSFMSTKQELTDPWEESTFDHILGNHPDVRARVLRRLIDSDPQARRRLRELYEEVLDTRLTQEFLDERLAHYKAIAADYEICSTDFLPLLERFLERRRDVVRAQLEAALGSKEPS